jgi:hypothetical protein
MKLKIRSQLGHSSGTMNEDILSILAKAYLHIQPEIVQNQKDV